MIRRRFLCRSSSSFVFEFKEEKDKINFDRKSIEDIFSSYFLPFLKYPMFFLHISPIFSKIFVLKNKAANYLDFLNVEYIFTVLHNSLKLILMLTTHDLLYSGIGVGVVSGSGVVDTQLGGYQVVLVKSPKFKSNV